MKMEKKNDSSDRRRFIRKLVGLTAVGALVGLLQEKTGLTPVKAANGDPLIIGQSNSGTTQTVLVSSPSGLGALIAANESNINDSTGLVGEATATSGNTKGVWGKTYSPSGMGVEGQAWADTGTAYGVFGVSEASSGIGVKGLARAASGETKGVYGESWSSSGSGVYGYASAGSGSPTGVFGRSDSTSGRGIEGWATATSGYTAGVGGESESTTGIGVRGTATALSGHTYGLFGLSESTEGIGVFGQASATTGSTYGVYGLSVSTSGIGVFGIGSAASGETKGVYGESWSSSGSGVYGYASATSGLTYGVFGKSRSPDGKGVLGSAEDAGTGVHGESVSGIGVLGDADGATAIPIVARGASTQAASLQQWRNSAGTPLSAINKDGWMGVGTGSPARSIHLVGTNACFRMDRDVNSSAFILVRTAPGNFGTVWKTFYVGVDASGVNNGEFFIGDVGTNVSGPSAKRLWIDNSGGVHIPNLISGDITLANDFIVTEEEKRGIAFKNDAGEKIAVLDRKGNLHIKGDVIKDL